jgi:hypothetical protein
VIDGEFVEAATQNFTDQSFVNAQVLGEFSLIHLGLMKVPGSPH